MTDQDEPWECTVARAHANIDATRADIAFARVAEHADEDHNAAWTRMWNRLADIDARDLAVMVADLLGPEGAADGDRLWSEIHTVIPEDVR